MVSKWLDRVEPSASVALPGWQRDPGRLAVLGHHAETVDLNLAGVSKIEGDVRHRCGWTSGFARQVHVNVDFPDHRVCPFLRRAAWLSVGRFVRSCPRTTHILRPCKWVFR